MNVSPQTALREAVATSPLCSGEIQIWRMDAKPDGELATACEAFLSGDEKDRWTRMRQGTARDEFRVGRGCLRALIGAALKTDAHGTEFRTGEQGKPFVPGIEFNVAHSRGIVLIALCRDAEIGVDLEWMDSNLEVLDLAREHFAPREIAAIEAEQPGPSQVHTFYQCWTRKEATVKAEGQGLLFPLADFAVPAGHLAHEFELRLDGERAFYLRELPVDDGFVAALAARKAGLPVRQVTLREAAGYQRFQVTTEAVTLQPYARTQVAWRTPVGPSNLSGKQLPCTKAKAFSHLAVETGSRI